MKRIVLLLVLAIMASCRQGDVVDKPENLLSEDDMANILYDMGVLQSMHSQVPQAMQDKGIEARDYIFTKYKIDSLTFAQNNKYYASRPEQYQNIRKQVTERLNIEKAALQAKPTDSKAAKPKGSLPNQ